MASVEQRLVRPRLPWIFVVTGVLGLVFNLAVLAVVVQVGFRGTGPVGVDRLSTLFLPLAMTAAACSIAATATAPGRAWRATAVVLLLAGSSVSGLATAYVARSAVDNCLSLAPPTHPEAVALIGRSLSFTGTVTCRWSRYGDQATIERTSFRFFAQVEGSVPAR